METVDEQIIETVITFLQDNPTILAPSRIRLSRRVAFGLGVLGRRWAGPEFASDFFRRGLAAFEGRQLFGCSLTIADGPLEIEIS